MLSHRIMKSTKEEEEERVYIGLKLSQNILNVRSSGMEVIEKENELRSEGKDILFMVCH